ncbi:DUF7670 domain-containing protein [Lacisediminihabitans profunda]|uniref:DUF7670 domain-containing protein n=1 Tax=Lacisediminihabitans profunda TaxID=2594790 RepID=A0A5C8UUK7_9MICO|nr:hypothetical protein [Lacisediminihabitans profunda]TXN31986.1 hypothetical protein FVP33_03425 [Lacisediminihabitans profunda]
MAMRKASAVGWVARVLGILLVVVMAYGWWDEVQARGGRGTWLEQWAVITHVIPGLVLIAAVVLGWSWPLVGAIGFLGYAVATVFSYAPEWAYAPLVSGPPILIGLLFLIDWLLSRRRITA